jgi:cytochrome c553
MRCTLGLLLLAVLPAPSQSPRPATTTTRPTPRLEAVAETRLLMDGLNQPNVRGLERLLKARPDSVEAWTFGRGQALLIAETGNLLLLRPPRNTGLYTWQEIAMQLRANATHLAQRLAAQDYEGSRTALGQVAAACNRCHQSFRVPTRIQPFATPDARSTDAGR